MSFPIEGFIPPQDIKLEEAIIGALLIESTAISRIEDYLKAEDFYSEQNKILFKAIEELYSESKPTDMMMVTEKLMREKTLTLVGGALRISEIAGRVASTVSLEHHALVVKQKSIEREAVLNARQLIGQVQEGVDINDILFASSKRIEELQESLIGKDGGQFIQDVLKKADIELSARMELARKNIRSGIDTGLHDLNKRTNGWQKSDLIILAARPAMGKTALLLHLAKSAAKSGVPVCLFSLEMSDVSLVNRMILSIADVDAEKFKSGYISNDEYLKIQEAMRQLAKLPIYIDDNASASMGYIRAKCRLLKKQGKCGMIFVDYLQLADSDEKSGNREQEVAKMSRTAKKVAKELEVPFILLSQLSRKTEDREGKRPMLADLRESGAIEQDADMVIFIHRPEYYKIEVTDSRGNIEKNYGELIIAKFRNGATGMVKFKHNDSMTKFFDYDNVPASEPPPAFEPIQANTNFSNEMPF